MSITISQIKIVVLTGNVKFIMVMDSIKKTDEVKENVILNESKED